MRFRFTIFLTLITLAGYGQDQHVGLFIPQDDGSEFRGNKKHMWVGQANTVSTIRGNDLIRVRTTNGKADSISPSFYSITPDYPNSVVVHTIHRIRNGNNIDTVSAIDTFYALIKPSFTIEIIRDNFKKDSTIQFRFIDSATAKLAGNRYDVGRMYEPFIFDSNDSLIGRLGHCFDTIIDFRKDKAGYDVDVRSGDKIQLRIWVRDTETDLLFPAKELMYTLK